MKLRSLIIEDEQISREILRNYLKKYCPDVTVVGIAKDVREGIELIRKTNFDLLFLDIELPYGNAFDIIEHKGDKIFETIFITAYEQYAQEALNNHAAYYILKPISIDELIKAVDYVKSKYQQKTIVEDTKPISSITISNANNMDFIEVKDIMYCTAQDNYTQIVLKDKKILASKPLKYFNDKLQHNDFVRIHRSHLVNIQYIAQYYKGSGGYVKMKNGTMLDVAANRKKAFLALFK